MDKTASDLTCAIRPADSGCGYLTVRNCTLHGNQCGVGAGAQPMVVTIEDTTLTANGLSDGQSHNLYIGQVNRLVLTNVTSTQPTNGHAVKSRAFDTQINGGTFDSPHGSPIEFPQGTAKPFVISGATINKAAGDDNHNVFGYAVESTINGAAGGSFAGCTFNLGCAAPFFQVAAGNVALDATCQWNGAKPVAKPGGVVTGLPG